MSNQVKPEYETIIYNSIRDYPTHEPRRVSNEPKAQGILISEIGVYNVLKRKGVNHRITRLFYAQEHSDNPVITESYLREKEKKEEIHIKAFYPGYPFCQDTFYVGTIKAWVESTSRPVLMPIVISALPRSIPIRKLAVPLTSSRRK